jgi:hypothetical protein
VGRAWLAIAVVAAACTAAGTAWASPRVAYGIQDDAWLAYGPGTLEQRVRKLDRLGVKLVRYTLRWDQIAATQPLTPRRADDPAYQWGAADTVLPVLRAHDIDVLLTIWGAPRWTNGGLGPNFAPLSKWSIALFAEAAAARFPWVRKWLIWNEPNLPGFLEPTNPSVYVQRILNPAYDALHAVSRANDVGGGATAPYGPVSAVAWIHGMRAARARLDAYAHNPYPARPHIETPLSTGCGRCHSLTMASLQTLQRETSKAWGPVRLWLTEYGYQTNPPDPVFGVSLAAQARYVADAALRVYWASRVDMLVQFLVRDDADPDGWQSGLFSARGRAKPAARVFPLPLAQMSRRGAGVTIWGQLRAHQGRRPYRLQEVFGSFDRWIGGTRRTDARGFFQLTVRAEKGAKLRVWSPLDERFSAALLVH